MSWMYEYLQSRSFRRGFIIFNLCVNLRWGTIQRFNAATTTTLTMTTKTASYPNLLSESARFRRWWGSWWCCLESWEAVRGIPQYGGGGYCCSIAIMLEAYNNLTLSSHDTLNNNLAVMEVNAITSSIDLFLSQFSLAPQRAYRSGVELHADSAPVTQACERVCCQTNYK